MGTRELGGGRGWVAAALGAVALSLAVQACGSSSSGTPRTSITSTPATAKTSPTVPSSTPGSAANANVRLTYSGDITGTLTPDADAPLTCGQTGRQSAVIRGEVGGHKGSILLTSMIAGTVAFPSKDNLASAAYQPDGVGVPGPSYKASSFARAGQVGAGQGSITFTQDGSGSVDLVIPYDIGNTRFTGTSVHVTGDWTC